MKYLIIILTAITFFLGYKSYENSKKLEEVTSFMSEIKEMMNPKDPPQIAIGTSIPDFSLLNAENKTVSLDSLPNTQKIFVFSAVGCPYCEDYYPELATFSKKHEEIPLIVFQNGASVEENKEFLMKKNYTFEMLKGNDEIYEGFMVSGTPTTIIVDVNNKVLKVGYFSTSKEIEEALL